MINRENSYFYYGDHGGSLVFYHIVSPEEDPKHLMPSFLKRFGQERGGALYEEYAAAKRRVLQRQQSPTSESGKLQ